MAVMNTVAPAKISFKQQMLQAREDAIIRAVNLLLAEKGFEAMTVDEVAAQVGIAKASLYKHFPSKEDLGAAAMARSGGGAIVNIASAAAFLGTPQGMVYLRAVAADGGDAVITVADRGPGIADGDRGRVLDRFVRLETSRSRPGSGLGLSLAAAVARLHGGGLSLDDNRPGLKVALRLPRLADDTNLPVRPA